MKLKNNIFTTFLLAIGLLMHQITPGILGGMKFDFLLIFMFVAILLNHRLENAILSGLLGGLLSAMTTTFPGGQIANILDKIIASLVILALIKGLSRFKTNYLVIGLLGGIGTFVSGMVFLTSVAFLSGLPTHMSVLIFAVVIPTSLVNSVGTPFIYRLVKEAMKRSGIIAN